MDHLVTIKARCPVTDRDVEATPDAFSVALASDLAHTTYAWTCPGCQDVHVRHACRDVLTLLRLAGVRFWRLPEQVPAEARDLARIDPAPLRPSHIDAAVVLLGTDVDLVAVAQTLMGRQGGEP